MTGKERTAYRRTKRWKEIRELKLKETDNCCEICGVKRKKGLQIHHVDPATYGKEKLSDLVVLCASDHKNLERLLRRTKNKVDIDEYCKNLKRVYKRSKSE